MSLPTLADHVTYAFGVFNSDPRPLDIVILSGALDHLDSQFVADVYHMLCVNGRQASAQYLQQMFAFAEPKFNFSDYPSEYRSDMSETDFLSYCQEQQITPIRRIQQAQYGEHQKSWVYLVQDRDGLFKVYKEELDYTQRPIKAPRESEVMRRLQGLPGVPRFYDVVTYRGHRYIRMEMIYGQPMTWMTQTHLLPATARQILRELAQILSGMLARGVLYLDLKPENIMLTEAGPIILDFGVTAYVDDPTEVVDIFLCDPRYATPEGVFHRQATEASLVYQLGLLYYQMMFAQHPNGQCGLLADNFDQNVQHYAIHNATTPYHVVEALREFDQVLDCERLLNRDPLLRPRLADIVTWESKLPACRVFAPNPKPTLGSMIFPARMGIPHKGHLDYLCRLMYAGYHVVISFQWSYILTDRDPLPKWIVADLVRHALKSRGWFEGEHYRCMFTSFYETDEQHKMHFLMMPGFEDVIGAASGNPEIYDLFSFSELPIYEQHCFFACEHDETEYEVRSWGEHLRTAVKENDYTTFLQYAVPGHEDILSFEETRALYHEQHIEFVPGTVTATLHFQDRVILRDVRVRRYIGPVESLLQKLKIAKNQVIAIKHRSQRFDGTDLHIEFDLVTKTR